jgi:sulfite reductase (NADPH) flavoprotein alpha-component
MSHIAPRLPANAPFSALQRAWIDGFLAGFIDPAGGASSADAPVAAIPEAPPSAPEDFPWHDSALPIEDRLALSTGRPRGRRLMSAMAQLDCGQCGYLCRTYAEAIDAGTETSLARCVPGGKETSRTLKEILAEAASPPGPAPAAAISPAAAPPASASPLDAPQGTALFQAALRLSREGSEKDTRHVVLRLPDSKVAYEVGDSLAVFAENCPTFVDAIIERLAADPGTEVDCPDGRRRGLRDALATALDIARPADTAIEVLASRATGPGESDRLQALAEGYPGVEPADADLLELLDTFPSARPPLQELISALAPLQPRLYSISSSPKAAEGEVHLTVDAVRYERRRRSRKGVASTFLADRAQAGQGVPVSVQRSHGFRLPKPDAPIVMIGPGTGVAPFRAFLQERRAVGAAGRNWLFFGAQRRRFDYLYEDELEGWHRDGHLARLDTAFSRDQADKVYVQQRMREAAGELWAWLQEGAHLYVCGDAQRMARDVDTALAFLVAKHGGMDRVAAKAYLAGLAREGRYQRDVY